jgi:hypothetical protein
MPLKNRDDIPKEQGKCASRRPPQLVPKSKTGFGEGVSFSDLTYLYNGVNKPCTKSGDKIPVGTQIAGSPKKCCGRNV